jgi:hypothetical protein
MPARRLCRFVYPGRKPARERLFGPACRPPAAETKTTTLTGSTRGQLVQGRKPKLERRIHVAALRFKGLTFAQIGKRLGTVTRSAFVSQVGETLLRFWSGYCLPSRLTP